MKESSPYFVSCFLAVQLYCLICSSGVLPYILFPDLGQYNCTVQSIVVCPSLCSVSCFRVAQLYCSIYIHFTVFICTSIEPSSTFLVVLCLWFPCICTGIELSSTFLPWSLFTVSCIYIFVLAQLAVHFYTYNIYLHVARKQLC
jgi:hypothetical protein